MLQMNAREQRAHLQRLKTTVQKWLHFTSSGRRDKSRKNRTSAILSARPSQHSQAFAVLSTPRPIVYPFAPLPALQYLRFSEFDPRVRVPSALLGYTIENQSRQFRIAHNSRRRPGVARRRQRRADPKQHPKR